MRPIFKLDERLKICADMIPIGSKIADIGTDHGYLPIWLTKNNIIKSAIASDINELPLKQAQKNILKYHVDENVKVRLSNGLDNINENEADVFIIAGMGGNIISEIIQRAKWLKNKNKTLLLQPMSADDDLRRYLYLNNFKIIKEKAVISNKKVYTVIKSNFLNQNINYDDIDIQIGGLRGNIPTSKKEAEAAKKYIIRKQRHLNNILMGCNEEKSKILKNVIENLKQEEERYSGYCR